MIVIVLLIDALGYNYLPPKSFWKRHSTPIRNAVPTITAPNFTTILTGKLPKDHGVLNNEMVGKPGFVFRHSTFFDDVPKRFKKVYVSNWAQNRKFIHKDVEFVHTTRVWDECKRQMTRKGDLFIAVNTDRLDWVAHGLGWGGEPYMRTLKNIDRHTRELADLLSPQDILIGTADHGGIGVDHEEEHEPNVRMVPLLLFRRPKPRTKATTGFRKLLKQLLSH